MPKFSVAAQITSQFFFLSLAIPTSMVPSFYHLQTKLDNFLAEKKNAVTRNIIKINSPISSLFCFLFFTDTNFWHSDFIQLLKHNPVTRDTLYNWQVTFIFLCSIHYAMPSWAESHINNSRNIFFHHYIFLYEILYILKTVNQDTQTILGCYLYLKRH